MSIPIQRIKDQPGGVWAENRSNLIPSAFGAPNRGGTMYVQPYVEEVMRRILKDLEDRGYDLNEHPNLFRIASSHRTQAEQDILFAKALKKHKTEDVADDYVAKISAHQTGAVIDIDLGGPTKSEYIAAYRDSNQFHDWSDLAYNKYKMAPYDVEPWHWECGNACIENINKIMKQENGSKPVRSENEGDVENVGNNTEASEAEAKEKKSNALLYVTLGSVALLATGAYLYKKQKERKRALKNSPRK